MTRPIAQRIGVSSPQHTKSEPITLRFFVPGKPVGKAYRSSRGRLYLTKAASEYQHRVRCRFLVAIGDMRLWDRPSKADVTLEVWFWPGPGKAPDEDNVLKCCQDALTALAYKDDAQVKDGQAHRMPTTGSPRTEVEVTWLT